MEKSSYVDPYYVHPWRHHFEHLLKQARQQDVHDKRGDAVKKLHCVPKK